MTMKIIAANRNSSVGHGGWRQYVQLLKTEADESALY